MQMPNQFIHNMKWGGVKSILTLLLGLFLLVAAALKIHGLIVDPYAHDNFLSAPWLQVLTIEVEVLLGLWLLSKLQQQLAWYATLLFFVALSIISFLLATQGQSSCGCFGKVEVNPWYTFALDVSIVLLMVLVSLRTYVPLSFDGRGVRGEGEAAATPLGSILQIALFTTVLLGAITLGFTLYTGDPWAALARLRGETLTVTPAVTQLGEGTAGELRTFQIQLNNYGDKPVKVTGGTSSCSCIATQDLRIILPAGSNQTITITARFTGTPGKYLHRFRLFNDSNVQSSIARFTGTVVSNQHSLQPSRMGLADIAYYLAFNPP